MMRISLSNRSTNNKYYYVIYNYFILTGMYITAIKLHFQRKNWWLAGFYTQPGI